MTKTFCDRCKCDTNNSSHKDVELPLHHPYGTGWSLKKVDLCLRCHSILTNRLTRFMDNLE